MIKEPILFLSQMILFSNKFYKPLLPLLTPVFDKGLFCAMNMNEEICNLKKHAYNGAFRKYEDSLMISAPCKLNVTYGVTVWAFDIA